MILLAMILLGWSQMSFFLSSVSVPIPSDGTLCSKDVCFTIPRQDIAQINADKTCKDMGQKLVYPSLVKDSTHFSPVTEILCTNGGAEKYWKNGKPMLD